MSKKKMEEVVLTDEEFDLDDSYQEPMVEPSKVDKQIDTKEYKRTTMTTEEPLVNCLRNERIVVRYIPKERGLVTNPKHILYGGMAENATRTFVVPKLSSGMFVNVLTDSEKAFLEDIMGLEYNALSIYKKVDNFWDDSNENGISKVRLTKRDNYLNLADPEDYIRYKILLANKNFIASSLQVLQDAPKATYQFVIVSEGDETKTAKDNMSATMKCYKEFGKIENDVDVLRVIVETLEGKPTAPSVKLEFLHTRINNLIQADSKTFLKVITDPLLRTKVLIKNCLESGIIYKKGDYYYVREGNTPLCGNNEEPTLSIAAKYLNLPKNQQLKFSLEAKLKK